MVIKMDIREGDILVLEDGREFHVATTERYVNNGQVVLYLEGRIGKKYTYTFAQGHELSSTESGINGRIAKCLKP